MAKEKSDDNLLEMRGVSKSFAGVTVLDKVDFNLRKGEVHVLIGENGAGKSTLMKILTGIYRKEAGEILLAGDDGHMDSIEFTNAKEAMDSGISMVFQEFNLINDMTIAENVFIGREPVVRGVLDRKKLWEDTRIELEKVDLDVHPGTLVGQLTTAHKQCVEIAKCLSHTARIIVLDEPTSSLSENEVTILFRLIRSLREKGVSIVYISHRMQEIFEIGDRITVFRDGRLIDTVEVGDTTESELVKMIIGREFENDNYDKKYEGEKEVMLEGRSISLKKFGTNIDFKAYSGEILGIFGLIGAGRTELVRAVFGIDSKGDGRLYKKGELLKIKNANDAIRYKIALAPEDRKELGLITMLDIRSNLTLVKLRELPKVLKSRKAESEIAGKYVNTLSIVTSGITQTVDKLSGGNQQKVAISKWLTMDMDILIFDEPTRGIDIGAKAEIYRIMRQLALEGRCIIMISSDLPEILRVSDRVLVMHDGEIKLDDMTRDLDQETIIQAAIK
jgi:ribose transport system ATP-binding protein